MNYFFKLAPRQFEDPASIVPVTVIAATLVPQNYCIGLLPPDDSVNFVIAWFTTSGVVFGNPRIISKDSVLAQLLAAGKTEAEALALWQAIKNGLLSGDPAVRYQTAVALAAEFGFTVLPLDQQTGNLFEPVQEEETETPTPDNE